MEPNKEQKRIFHTDHGRWDRLYLADDNIPDEFDEVEALGLHENEFHEPSGHIYSEDELEKVVKELLRNSKTLDSSDITVTVFKRDIILSGTVKNDQQKKSASSIVHLIDGIGHVKNDISVKINKGILPTDVGPDDEGRSS